MRVAVELGATVRVAAGGRVARLATAPGVPLGELLAGQLDGATSVVLVHPAGARPDDLARAAAEVAGRCGGDGADGPVAGRPVPIGSVVAPVAVAGAGDAVVVVAGRRGEVVRVRAGRVDGRWPVPGGDALDRVTAELVGRPVAEARRAREALSLLPAVRVGGPGAALDAGTLQAALHATLAELVRAVDAAGPGPVLLVGGVARTPLLAELLDRAGRDDVRVAHVPDDAPVLAALDLPPELVRPVAGPPPRAAPRPDVTTLMPPIAPRRPWRRLAALTGAAAFLAVLHLVGVALTPAAPQSVPLSAQVPSGVLVQYGYRVQVPAGWAHTGGLPERRRSLLTPLAAPEGSDLVVVERTSLGYDAGAEPERAAAELRAEYDAAVAGGDPLTGYDSDAEMAGRPVTAYREQDGRTTVRWYVVLDGDAQLSVGCRYTPSGERAVLDACAVVVGSVARA